jgi:uncharacterized protein involved in exopolysaccharide biosynthesis
MSRTLDFVHVESNASEFSSMNVGFGEVLRVALASLWRRKLLVGATVVTALAFGIVAFVVIPPSYTPEAYIRGGFVASNAVAKDEDSKSAPSVGLDLMRVIETQSRLLETHDLARRVVQQLGLERLQPELNQGHWLPQLPNFSGSKVTTKPDEIDLAAGKLSSGLSVQTDQLRTYLITVRYTGRDSALAVAITNAFVAEFLRSSKLQALSQQRSEAAAVLSKQRPVLGDKHPKVIKAKMQLAAVDDLLKQKLHEAPEVLLKAAGENVTTAIAAPARPSPRHVIGLFLFVGLVAGIGSALLLERRSWGEVFSHYIRPFA